MNRRSQAIIGATLLLLGLGVYALGLLEEESDVRYVPDLVADPAAHHDGSYTLIGVPQPATLTRFVDGEAVSEPNPDYDPTVTAVEHLQQGDRPTQTTYSLTAEGPDETGASDWTLTRTERVPGSEEAQTETLGAWTLDEPHHLFVIEAFDDGSGDPAVALGIYRGTLRDPVQPKPSQFVGHVLEASPSGVAFPDGIVVYDIQEYTAGCSSKFLPAEVAAEYDEDGDGVVD